MVTRYHLGTVLRVQEAPHTRAESTGLRPPREPGGDSRALPLPTCPGRHVWETESRWSRPRDTKKARRPPIRIPAASRPGRACQLNPHGRLRILSDSCGRRASRHYSSGAWRTCVSSAEACWEERCHKGSLCWLHLKSPQDQTRKSCKLNLPMRTLASPPGSARARARARALAAEAAAAPPWRLR